MEVLTFNSLYVQKLTNFLKETPNKIYLLCSQNCPSFNHHILKCAENLEDKKAIAISQTSSVANPIEIQQHTTKLKTNFIITDNNICLEFSTNLAIQDKSNFVLPILNMGKIHKQVRQKAIPALTKIGIEDELSLTTLFLMRKDTSLKHYTGHRGWPCFSSTPIIFKEEGEGLFAREIDNIIDHINLETKDDNIESDSEEGTLGYSPTNLLGYSSVVSQPGKSGTPSDSLDKTQENDWIQNFHAPPENRNKTTFYPKDWGADFFQTTISMIIQEPKFVVIMMELIKHTASNKLKTMKKTIKDKHQNDFDKLQRSSDFYSQPSEPQLSCYNCQYRFNTPQGANNHKRAFNCNKNHINMFLDDFVLRHYNTTEAEKTISKTLL